MPLVVLQEFQLAFTRAREQTEAREFFFGDIKTQFDEDRARLERFVFGHFLTSLSIMRMSSNWSLLLRLFVPRELALSDGQKKDAIAVKVHSMNTPPTY